MRSIAMCALLLAVSLPAAPAETAHSALKKRVAVMDMAVVATTLSTSSPGTYSTTTTLQIPPPADFALGLTEMLTTELMNSGRFIVLERKGLADATAEQDLGGSERANSEVATKAGGVIGAQALIRCAVTEYAYTQSGTSGQLKLVEGISLGATVVRAQVGIDVRVYDARTTQVLASTVARGSASTKGVDFKHSSTKADVAGAAFISTPLGQASRQAISRAIEFIVRELGEGGWEARVIRADPERIYVNAGGDAGVQQGATFDLFRAEEALIDPASGLHLGTPDRRLGAIQIVSVQPAYAVAKLIEGDPPQRNDIIRPPGGEARP
jgi:curli biogenesis system outer membrane secretion channel CsgG